MNHTTQTNLICVIVLLLMLSFPLAGVVQARPSYATSRNNHCGSCHTTTVSGRMEVVGGDSLLDLGTQLDGNRRGPLKTFRAAPGQVVTLALRVLDGSNNFAVQIKDFERPAQRSDANHRLVWSPANDPDNVWTRHQVNNPPYFTKDNGANGGLPGSLAPITYTFDLRVEPNTPADVYELVLAVPGRRSGQGVYQEEHVYLEVVSPFDLNDDGRVDCADICLLVEHWQTHDLDYDLGPMPGGDGVVDGQDLLVLSEHLFEDYRLVAHWPLDETEGMRAEDSVGERHGDVLGSAVWQPASGQVDGALLFDGMGAHISTPFVLSPGIRPFSVFAWIQGGGPGQVIVSQMNGADWLWAEAQNGQLGTDLKGPGRSAKPLASDVVITDGVWHRVGLVWDGLERVLYVDDMEVARDAQSELAGTSDGLLLGAGPDLSQHSFWSGLIDDIRIYDRAVQP